MAFSYQIREWREFHLPDDAETVERIYARVVIRDDTVAGAYERAELWIPKARLDSFPATNPARDAAILAHVESQARDVHAAWLARLGLHQASVRTHPTDLGLRFGATVFADVPSHEDLETSPVPDALPLVPGIFTAAQRGEE